MTSLRRFQMFTALFTLAAYVFPSPGGAVDFASAATCQAAGSSAERAYGLPQGILLAIGRVESGRRQPVTGQIVPWPWTINAAGTGHMFDSLNEAVEATQRLRDQGTQSIDVGCFQVNLQHHPTAFRDMMDAFDPKANAGYAARFLAGLYTKLHTWEDAVAAYHSSTPELGTPYRERVMLNWARNDGGSDSSQGVAPGSTISRAMGPTLGATWSPAMVQFGMQVWTPSRNGEAGNVISINAISGVKNGGRAALARSSVAGHVEIGGAGWSGCARLLQQMGPASKLKKC